LFIFSFRYRFGSTSRKPAIDLAIAGFPKICCGGLPFYSHDAKTKAITLPNGHATTGRRVLPCLNKRAVHFRRRKRHHFGAFVKEFLRRKSCFSGLVGGQGGGRFIPA
jgi:hypothetical protein